MASTVLLKFKQILLITTRSLPGTPHPTCRPPGDMLISSARRWVLPSCAVALTQLQVLPVLVSLNCIVWFGSAKDRLVSYRSQKPELATLWRNLTHNQTGRGLPTLTFEPLPYYTKEWWFIDKMECGPGSPLWHSGVLCGPADLFICEKRGNESQRMSVSGLVLKPSWLWILPSA